MKDLNYVNYRNHRASLVAVIMVLGATLGCVAPARAAESIEDWASRIDERQPGIIMVGSSMQGEGIDFPALSKAMGTPVFDARSGGSVSPWKYCFIKNVIPAAKTKPRLVVLETRVNNIVCPEKRMRWEVYKNAVEAIAGKDRALLDKLSYSSEDRPNWEYSYDQDEKGPPYDGYYWDFNKAVETSYLPTIIQLAKAGNYQLVVLLYKSRIYAEQPGWEPAQATKFRADMAAYLAKNGVVMLDYTQSPELKADMYANGDHLSRKTGRPVWTQMVIEDFKAILSGQTPPRIYGAKAADSAAAPASQPRQDSHRE